MFCVFTCFTVTREVKTRLFGLPGHDAAASKTSFSTSPEGADCSRGKTFRETQLVFPQIPHVSGSVPALHPCPTTDIRQDPVQPVVPHLMIGRQATGSVRCASSQHTLSPSAQGVPTLLGHRDWTAVELWVLRHISVCSPHLWQNQVCGSCHPCQHADFHRTAHRYEKERRKC